MGYDARDGVWVTPVRGIPFLTLIRPTVGSTDPLYHAWGAIHAWVNPYIWGLISLMLPLS